MTCVRCLALEREIARLRGELAKSQPTPDIEDVRDVFGYWRVECNHPRAKLTADRKAKVRARLRDGYTVDDLKQAVRGATKGAFRDHKGHVWDDLTLICRSGANVERFMQMAGPEQAAIAAKFLG